MSDDKIEIKVSAGVRRLFGSVTLAALFFGAIIFGKTAFAWIAVQLEDTFRAISYSLLFAVATVLIHIVRVESPSTDDDKIEKESKDV